MFDEEINKIWKECSEKEVIKLEKSNLIRDLKSQSDYFDGTIRNRNRNEILVALVLIPVFAAMGYFYSNIISKIGAILIVVWCLFVIYKLRTVRKRKSGMNAHNNLKDYLTAQKKYYINEMELLDSVLYWYLLPPFIAITLFWIGTVDNWIFFGVLMVFLTGLYYYVFKLNKDSVKNKFKPLIKKITLTLERLEEY